MRIVVFLISAVVQLVAAAVGLFVLLIALNGYSERQAMPSLIFYGIFCLLIVLVISAVGCLVAKSLLKRNWVGKVGASIVAIVSSSIVGVVLVGVAMFVAFALAETLRGMK